MMWEAERGVGIQGKVYSNGESSHTESGSIELGYIE